MNQKKQEKQFEDYYLQLQQTEFLTQELAIQRFQQIEQNSVHYSLYLLLKQCKSQIHNIHQETMYEGIIICQFKINHKDHDLFLEYRGKEILGMFINDELYSPESIQWTNTYIIIPKDILRINSVNIIKISIKNNYSRNGYGLVTFFGQNMAQYIYNQSEPWFTNQIFPCFDQPDIKARFSLTIFAPLDWIAISNEPAELILPQLEEVFIEEPYFLEIPIDFQKWQFKTTKLITTYLLAIAAGNWVEFECQNTYKNIPMRIYCKKELHLKAKSAQEFVFEVTNKSLEFFENFFQIPFQFSKYDSVFCSEYTMGAMEHPGCVTFLDRYLENEEFQFLVTTIVHEMAHMWIGNVATLKWWNETWFNESIVKCLEFVCLEKIKIQSKELPDVSLRRNERKQSGFCEDQYPVRCEVKDTKRAKEIFSSMIYGKGGGVIRQLFYRIGEQQFAKGLTNIIEKFKWNNVTLEDFINNMGLEEFDLKSWMKEWVESIGYNQLSGSLEENQILKVIQTDDKTHFLRNHKIKILLIKQDGTFDIIEELIQNKEITLIKLKQKYTAFFLNYEDLTFAQVTIDQSLLNSINENFLNYDCLFRQMVYNSLFLMVQKAQLTSIDYINFVIKYIQLETINNQNNLYYAVHQYTPKKMRGLAARQIFVFYLNKPDKQNFINLLYHYALDKQSIDDLINFSKQTFSLNLKYLILHLIHEQNYYSREFRENMIQEYETQYFTNPERAQNQLKLIRLKAYSEEKNNYLQQFLQPEYPFTDQQIIDNYINKRALHEDEDLIDNYFQFLLFAFQTKTTEKAVEYFEKLFPPSDNFEKLIQNFEDLINKNEAKKYEKLIDLIQKNLRTIRQKQHSYSLYENMKNTI